METNALIALGLSQVIATVTIISVLKTDMKWVKEWCATHEKNDQDRFRDLAFEDRRIEEANRDDRHDLRDDLQTIGNRVALLEGQSRRHER